MEIGVVGLGRMGSNITRRLLAGGHRVVAFDRSSEAVDAVAQEGAVAAGSLTEVVTALKAPRAIWLMVPSGPPVTSTVEALTTLLSPGDLVVDGGNTDFRDSLGHAATLAEHGIHFMDSGTSGGLWGLTVGFCLMLGGTPDDFARIEPALKSLAAEDGYAHVGPVGAGHYVKMVHNGIEYALLQSYAEGFELLKAADFLVDLGQVTHLWNHGSVVRSWLLELAESALQENPDLADIKGYVDDTGYGRATVREAIERAVPLPVITLSLMARFRSRQEDSFAAKVIAALREGFGGHRVRHQ